MKLTTNVYAETGYQGANVGYITTRQGIVMVDTPQRPTDAVAWRKQIKEAGEISYLINTHSHADHFFGNFFFDVPVIAHQKAREAILKADINLLMARTKEIDPDGLPLVSEYSVNAPTITFSENFTLYPGNLTIELIPLPGHSAGGIGVLIPEEKILFAGDNIFLKLQAFLHEADPMVWKESLKRIGELDVDCIIPGHGEICDKSCLTEQADFIQEWVDTVKAAIDKGWTKEESLSRISLLNRYPMAPGNEARGPELQRMNVARLYEVLTRK